MLAHLGVGRLLIIDFDHVTWSTLPRIVGATPDDAERRRRKIDVMRDLVQRIDPSIEVEAVFGDITYQQDAR
jgi:tRNA A37 threonylcarbamoyladenosine dehydratase